MARKDKYARASALSKIFEDMVSRKDGDKKAAKESMDSTLGKEWQLEIVIPDEVGPEFIDPELLDDGVVGDNEDRDCMFGKARKHAETFLRPGDDMEYDPAQEGDKSKDTFGANSGRLSKLFRQLADELDK
jgi:hypothetical protein